MSLLDVVAYGLGMVVVSYAKMNFRQYTISRSEIFLRQAK